MAVQDEGQVPFEKLPLRELKDWLEDWIDLPGVSVLGGLGGIPGDAGGSVINNALDEIGYQRSADGWLPRPMIYDVAAPAALVSGRIYCQRIVPRSALTLAGVKAAALQESAGGTSTYEVGIYNADGTSRLATTGATAVTVQAGSNEGYLKNPAQAFGASLALVADTEYLLAVLPVITAGTLNTLPLTAVEAHRTAWHPNAAVTVASVCANFFQFKLDHDTTTYATLPTSLLTNGFAAAHSDTPLVLLDA